MSCKVANPTTRRPKKVGTRKWKHNPASGAVHVITPESDPLQKQKGAQNADLQGQEGSRDLTTHRSSALDATATLHADFQV